MCLAVLSVISSCEKNEYGAPEKDKYIYDIPQTELQTDAIVGAYYLNYTSPVAEEQSPETPILGWYTTNDNNVMTSHIGWANDAGLDFFIFPWDGSDDDNNLVSLFMDKRTESTDVRYAICYNTSHLDLSNDKPLQSDDKYNIMLADFIDVLSKGILSDAYYYIDGRPVIMITPSNLSSSELLSIDYSKVIPRLRNDLSAFFGIDPYFIGELTTGWVAPVNYADQQIYSFDAISLKDWKTRSYDIFYGYFSFLDINMNNWKTTLSRRKVDFVPCVFPSYNDRKSSSSSYYYTFSEDGDPQDYINFCNVAKRNIGSKNIVLINAWNDWAHGANLEPSTLKESRFIDVTKSQFKK